METTFQVASYARTSQPKPNPAEKNINHPPLSAEKTNGQIIIYNITPHFGRQFSMKITLFDSSSTGVVKKILYSVN